MARTIEFVVTLTEKEKDYLRKNTFAGDWKVRVVKRARILLKADRSENAEVDEEEIAREVGCNVSTVRNIKLRFAKGERLKVLEEKPKSGRPRTIDGEVEAHIIATACSSPPEGQVRWTLQLIADKIVALTEMESCSPTSIARTLKKMNLSLG
jgi:transposase